MSRMRLIEFLSHPEKLDEKSLETLREALDAYPFFRLDVCSGLKIFTSSTIFGTIMN